MIANYGYADGSGSYYIRIDTNKCGICQEKGCIKVCPAGLFQIEVDDWDDEVVTINKAKRNMLRISCAACKAIDNYSELLPCKKSCRLQAIEHSW